MRYPPSLSHHPHHQHHLECKKTSNMLFLVRKQQLGFSPEARILNFPLRSSQTKCTISKRHTRNKMGSGKKIATQISTSTHTHTHTQTQNIKDSFVLLYLCEWEKKTKPPKTPAKTQRNNTLIGSWDSLPPPPPPPPLLWMFQAHTKCKKKA